MLGQSAPEKLSGADGRRIIQPLVVKRIASLLLVSVDVPVYKHCSRIHS